MIFETISVEIREAIKEKGHRWAEALKIVLPAVYGRINPAPMAWTDPALDYPVRALLLFFPLLTAESSYIAGYTGKDICFYILVLAMTLRVFFTFLRSDPSDLYPGRKAAWGLPAAGVLCAVLLALQIAGLDSQSYRMARYVGCILLMLCVGRLRVRRRYYIKLFLLSLIPMYGCFFWYIFTGRETLPGVARLLGRPEELVPFLLLACTAASLLYAINKRKEWDAFYAGMALVGDALLFLYGDMAAFCLLGILLLLIPQFYMPTLRLFKKSLTLLFLYGFAASNVALLPYMGAKGLDGKTFQLEYSIYIDMTIAVAGLLISRFLERYPQGSPQDTEIPLLREGFRKAAGGVGVFLLLCLLFDSGIAALPDRMGMPVLKAFAAAMKRSADACAGEWWYVLQRYGPAGAAVVAVLGILLLRRLYELNDGARDTEKAWILIGGLFMAQSLFYPLSAVSTPCYIVFLALALQTEAAKEMAAEWQGKRDEGVHSGAKEAAEWQRKRDEGVRSGVKEAAEWQKKRDEGVQFGVKEAADKGNAGGAEERDLIEGLEFMFLEDLPAEKPKRNWQTELLRNGVAAASGCCAAVLAVLLVIVVSRWNMALQSKRSDLPLTVLAQEQLAPVRNAPLFDARGGTWSDIFREKYAAALLADRTEGGAESNAGAERGEDLDEAEDHISISGGDYRIYDPDAVYEDAHDIVTARDGRTNLRTAPRLGTEGRIIHELTETERVERTGIGNNGWSRVVYQGQICYAVTEYLAVAAERAE